MNIRKKIIQGVCIAVFLLLFVIYVSYEEKQNEAEELVVVAETITKEEELPLEKKSVDNEELTTQEAEAETMKEEGEYEHLAFANVDDYVNVRSEPSTEGAIVGKIYDGAVAEIIALAGEERDWYEIISGNVTGYIKAEFFLRGNEAADIMDKYIVLSGRCIADRLNVRSRPDTKSKKIGYLNHDEKVRVLEKGPEWIKIQYGEEQEGYVYAQYLSLSEEFLYAKTMEELEEMAKQEKLKAEELLGEKQSVIREELEEAVVMEVPVETVERIPLENEDELRQQIVNYAMQYVGNKYISGGQSLAGGTDCSGFTCFVYADFGYAISRTPQGQLSSSGRSINYSEAKPGDIICYSSNGGKSCTHVALYMGEGQVVHSANSRKGVIVQNADYDRIIGVKNVIN